MLARTQAERHLDIDIRVSAGDGPTPNLVPIAADREIEQWRSAAERLRKDADTQLPTSDQSDRRAGS